MPRPTLNGIQSNGYQADKSAVPTELETRYWAKRIGFVSFEILLPISGSARGTSPWSGNRCVLQSNHIGVDTPLRPLGCGRYEDSVSVTRWRTCCRRCAPASSPAFRFATMTINVSVMPCQRGWCPRGFVFWRAISR